MDAVNQPSLSVASLPRKAVVVAFGSRIVLGRYRVSDDEAPSPLNSVVIDDDQLVRGVAFLKIPDGPLCLVSGGDGKYINVYNISSWKRNNPDAFNISSSDDDEAAVASEGNSATAKTGAPAKRLANDLTAHKWVPSYRYGPHTKRITHVTATDDGTIVFADKFGEVYRLCLNWGPDHTIGVEGNAAQPARFLLQHFSILSTMYLTSPVPRLDPIAASEERSGTHGRRLFTCDKDRHARVSRYPETYQVEQYLWTKTEAQSVVTCVTEIPYLSDEEFTFGLTNANKVNRKLNAPYSYYVTGYHDGHVAFWAARNDLTASSPHEAFHCFTSFPPKAELGAVISVVYVANDRDQLGNLRHPRDTPRGIVIAHEKSKDIFFVPVFDNVGEYGMHATRINGAHATLPELPVAVVSANANTALALLRNGMVVFVRLVETGSGDEREKRGDRPKLCSFNANVLVELVVLEQVKPFFEEKVTEAISQERADKLAGLDLFAQWKSEASDPRNRKHANSDDDGDGGADESDAVAALNDVSGDGSPEKKRARSQKK